MGDSEPLTKSSCGEPSYGSLPDPHRRSTVLQLAEKLLGDDDDCCHVHQYQGQATLSSQVITISKNLIGAGVLFLPNGIAMYGDSPQAAISACFWIAMAGLLFGYFAALIGRVCGWTGASSYSECWNRSVGCQGSSGISLAVSMITTLQPALAYLALSSIMVTTFLPLLQAVGLRVTMTKLLLILTILVILPLCFKGITLLSLAPVSAFGMTGICYLAIVMVLRWIDGSYQEGGKYYDDKAISPAFGITNNAWSTKVLPFFCIMFETWILMHYNIPRYYTELKDASFLRFVRVVGFAFGGTALVYMAISVAGFLTFGRNVDGFVLNSYSPQDPLMLFGRLAFGMSLLTTIPLIFVGVRDGLLDCLSIVPHSQTTFRVNAISVGLLIVLTLCSVVLMSSLDVIKAVTQGILATLLVFVFPQVMYQRYVAQHPHALDETWHVRFSMILMLLGVLFGIVGAVVAASIAEMMKSAMPENLGEDA